jgi:hypothetical protein
VAKQVIQTATPSEPLRVRGCWRLKRGRGVGEFTIRLSSTKEARNGCHSKFVRSNVQLGYGGWLHHASRACAAARISVTGAGRIRYRDDGGTPTASVGHPVTQYAYFWIIGRQQLENFRVIEEATSALYVTYFDNVNDVG